MIPQHLVKRIKSPELVAKGLQLHHAGEWSAAMDCYAAVLKKHPRHAIAYYLMGLLFEAIAEPRQALQCLDESLKIKPTMAETHYNKGVVLMWLGQTEEARTCYERCLQIDPRFAPAYVNYGNVLLALGDHDAAIRAYDRATELVPGTAEGIHNQSFVHLLRGEWLLGWEKYEKRWELPGHGAANPLPPIPRWQGESLEGKRILVLHEQGAGDTLMTLRYIPGLRFLGAEVTIRVPESLVRLIRWSFPECTVQPQTEPWPEADYCVPTMSLPLRFQTTPETVPFGAAPYLVPPMGGPDVPLNGGLRIGFAWKGSAQHKNDRNRSTPLGQWQRLLKVPGIQWYAIQQEISEPERLILRQTPRVHVVSGIKDWADTANVLSKLDCLIAVDTGLVHLAGALQVPTLVLLSAIPDFRWQIDTEKSPWYNTLRLIRQFKQGQWQTVFARAEGWAGEVRNILMGEAA